MTVQTTANLTNAIRTQYVAEYIKAAQRMRIYDQLALPVPGISVQEAMKGSSVLYNFLSDLQIVTAAISQTADITPAILYDATASVTPTSRDNAVQWSENLDIQAYTNRGAATYEALGLNQMESVDHIAAGVATAGSWFWRNAARASLDKDTAGDRASDALFSRASVYLEQAKSPPFMGTDGNSAWGCIMHPFPFYDIRESGNVDSIGLYQEAGIHLNHELGKLGPFRLSVTPFAHVFYAAGVANGTAVSSTLATATNPLATSFDMAAAGSTAAGMWLTIGPVETAAVMYPDTERVYVTGVATNTISFIGEGSNAGLRFPHAAGVAISNADSVYPLIFGGPASMVKLYAPSVGEFGQTVGPKVSGLADQFTSLAWKWYGGYGRIAENRLFRMEVSASMDL